jgi:hypothetical protein
MKVLNLDKLAVVTRQVVLFGEKHAVVDMTVENFIETTTQAEALASEESPVKQVESAVEMVVRSVPTASPAKLKRLNMDQLKAIIEFIRGDDVDGVEETQEEEGEKK